MAIIIHYQNQRHEIEYSTFPTPCNAHLLFSQSIISPRPLCTGIGKCGRCKVQYLNNIPECTAFEKTLLTEDEITNNIRLSCKHQLLDNTEFIIFSDVQKNATNHVLQLEKLLEKTAAQLYVDLGTTSIAWEVRTTVEKLASGQILNPQMFAGADVMTRLYYVNFIEKKSPSLLQNVIFSYLISTIQELANYNIIIEKIHIGANPSMIAILLGEDCKGLMQAPYFLANKGNKIYSFPSLPPIYIAPQLSAFIGADACAGFAYILDNYKEVNNFILADLGTNGEFIFYNNNTVYAASIPLGPALEGVGMRCGGAVHGKGENIILNFSLSPTGLSYTCTGTPQYICGAAYLNLINILLSVNLIDRNGFFIESNSPLAKKIQQKIITENNEKRLYITDNLYICAEDIENILKVKAAFSSAIKIFMQQNSIENIFLSGSLSNYIPLETLENLGFLPKNSKHKTKIVGNTSLQGLISLDTNPSLLDSLLEKLQSATIIDLTNQSEYNTLYIDNMHF